MNTVLFDLDGTVVESKEGIVNVILYFLDKMGIAESNPEELLMLT